MAEKTSWDGAPATETDINTYLTHTGGAFNTWTPTVTQSSGITLSASAGYYWRAGRMIFFAVSFTASSAGSSGTSVTVSLPVTAARNGQVVGTGSFTDNGTATYSCIAVSSSTTAMIMQRTDTTTLSYVGGAFAVASGDSCVLSGFYEAAS